MQIDKIWYLECKVDASDNFEKYGIYRIVAKRPKEGYWILSNKNNKNTQVTLDKIRKYFTPIVEREKLKNKC